MKYSKSWALALGILASLSAPGAQAGSDGTRGGGDLVAIDFKSTAIRMVDRLANQKKITWFFGLSAADLKSDVSMIDVSSTREPLYLETQTRQGGPRREPVDAINYPRENRVVVNRQSWKEAKSEVEKQTLVAHELASLLEAQGKFHAKLNACGTKEVCNTHEQGGFYFSRQLVDALQRQGEYHTESDQAGLFDFSVKGYTLVSQGHALLDSCFEVFFPVFDRSDLSMYDLVGVRSIRVELTQQILEGIRYNPSSPILVTMPQDDKIQTTVCLPVNVDFPFSDDQRIEQLGLIRFTASTDGDDQEKHSTFVRFMTQQSIDRQKLIDAENDRMLAARKNGNVELPRQVSDAHACTAYCYDLRAVAWTQLTSTGGTPVEAFTSLENQCEALVSGNGHKDWVLTRTSGYGSFHNRANFMNACASNAGAGSIQGETIVIGPVQPQ